MQVQSNRDYDDDDDDDGSMIKFTNLTFPIENPRRC